MSYMLLFIIYVIVIYLPCCMCLVSYALRYVPCYVVAALPAGMRTALLLPRKRTGAPPYPRRCRDACSVPVLFRLAPCFPAMLSMRHSHCRLPALLSSVSACCVTRAYAMLSIPHMLLPVVAPPPPLLPLLMPWLLIDRCLLSL